MFLGISFLSFHDPLAVHLLVFLFALLLPDVSIEMGCFKTLGVLLLFAFSFSSRMALVHPNPSEQLFYC